MLLAMTVFYATSKHQRLFRQALNKNYRLIGYVLLLIALIASTWLFNSGAAFFVWLMFAMLTLMLLPVLALFIKRKP